MKTCFKCKGVLPLTEFYKHPKTADGLLNKCKSCTKSDVKINYKNNTLNQSYIDSERKRGRDKYRRLYEGTGKANRDSIIRYESKYPEKAICKRLCSNLIKPFNGAEKHHWSYNKEHAIDVIWLTKKHHMKAHRFIKYDKESFMYRRVDNGELLTTKEVHYEYIIYCINNLED